MEKFYDCKNCDAYIDTIAREGNFKRIKNKKAFKYLLKKKKIYYWNSIGRRFDCNGPSIFDINAEYWIRVK